MCFISKTKKLFIILSSVFSCYLYASEIIPSDNHLKVNIKSDVTIVDISRPDGNGLSHNQFSKFNVSEVGVVLNNRTEDSQSYLAGEIERNINLRGSSASLIINEIISDDPSDLSGLWRFPVIRHQLLLLILMVLPVMAVILLTHQILHLPRGM